jgi:serine/threonine-protein kinase
MSVIPQTYIMTALPHLTNIQELKTGGQKTVYNVGSRNFGDVVLKVVLNDGDDKRVLREIDIVKNNSFPNVPIIYEFGTFAFDDKAFIYIFEQKISGTDLRTKLEIEGKLPLFAVLNFMDNLLSTAVELEKSQIVHRDIKPENILHDEQDKYWLIDFGIARDINNLSLTATSANFGPHTAGYAPPEQYRNLKRQIDSRTDLFSIGVVAYEMLHGFNPFTRDASNIIDVYMKTETLTEDSLKIPEDSNGELSGFIQTLMQRNHTFRPPTAAMALAWFREVATTLKGEE